MDRAMLKSGSVEGRAIKRHNLCQLYQWHLRQSKKKSNAGLSLEILDRSHEAFISVDPTVSKLQDDVVAQLSSIGLIQRKKFSWTVGIAWMQS
eukprot:scaffold9063_cov126-Skeletonema_menzelii.AAC.2